ncbi:cold shock domain-containing protein [Corallococcus sp. bb12-1]|uniref:cold-shock protein n=1 Tax=Corallococcus sp. bb12-1 TaxID=2996784 RepID=UPI00226FB929|nr:cold shock domain-containing protein [Corallococcus sp. bb12-1]MCY1047427.1 cold shock domain-containing protein [Corallococcus sp. bb12-1]
MGRGTVKCFDPIKGFGFITPDEGGHDLLFEFVCLAATDRPDFKEGQRVEFDPIPGSAAPEVKNLRRRA